MTKIKNIKLNTKTKKNTSANLVRSKSKIKGGSPNGTLILKHRCLASVVHSKLDYCNSLYYNLPKSQIFAYEVLSTRKTSITPSDPHIVFSIHVESARLLIHPLLLLDILHLHHYNYLDVYHPTPVKSAPFFVHHVYSPTGLPHLARSHHLSLPRPFTLGFPVSAL